MDLQSVSDHIEIRDLLARYCRGIDRGDKALIASVYHDDAYDDHGTFKGSPREFAEVVVDRMDGTGVIGQHNVTNVLIELDGDRARGESYFVTWNPEADATGMGRLMLVLGRYLDTFERRDGVWKIATRQVVIDWTQPEADGSVWPRLQHFSQGGRRERDPSHGFFKTA
jgi:hypothetical protein